MIRKSHRWSFVLALLAAACGGSTEGGGGPIGGECVHDGKIYQPGESYQLDCNTCSCSNGDFACTAMACAAVCVHGGQTHPPGSSFPAGDGCNTCFCDVDGTVSCTLVDCAPTTCTYAGKAYAPGDSFPAIDGCNKCSCGSDGNVSCTEISCPCDPAKEWWREYVGKSPAECATIKYACPEHTTPFANDCGCGCEQDASCPQWFDCMPPAACDPDQIAKCPYSGVAY